MKTAEELVRKKRGTHLPPMNAAVFTLHELRQIQLDAMKEGMRRAANNICFDVMTNRMMAKYNADGALDCQLSILTAAEQITEKDIL